MISKEISKKINIFNFTKLLNNKEIIHLMTIIKKNRSLSRKRLKRISSKINSS